MVFPQLLTNCCESTASSSNEKALLLKRGSWTIAESIAVRNERVTISGSLSQRLSQLCLSSLTFVNTDILFRNVHLKASIRVIHKARFTCENCTLEPFDEGTEITVDVSGGARVIMTGCQFVNNNKFSIVFQEHTQGTFESCNFQAPQHSSVLAAGDSAVVIRNSQFANAPVFAIYLFSGSKGIVEDCVFGPQAGKAIFVYKNCVCGVTGCRFERMYDAGVSLSDHSRLYMSDCEFIEMKGSAVHGTKGCVMEIENCRVRECAGNGVNFEFSSGFVKNCEFRNLSFPAIAVFGPPSTPVIYNCEIVDCAGMGIVARDGCSPTFSALRLRGIRLNGFSVSDYSRPIIRDCVLASVGREPFAVFNGARPKIVRNRIETTSQYAFCLMTGGSPEFRNNDFVGSGDFRLGQGSPPLRDWQFKGNRLLQDAACFEVSLGHSRMEIGRQVTPASTPLPPPAGPFMPRPFHGILIGCDSIEALEPPPIPRQAPLSIDVIAKVSRESRHRGACMNCHVREATRVCSPCGHAVLCGHCGADFGSGLRTDHLCPLCSTPVAECVEVYQESQCAVCMSAPADTTILPCGHQCVCYADALRLWQVNRQCPICRSTIGSFKRFFAIYTERDEEQLCAASTDSQRRLCPSQAMAESLAVVLTRSNSHDGGDGNECANI
jgi:hypothetical protein